MFLFEFCQELFGRISASTPRKSCVQHDFRIYVNCGVEPRFLFIFELNLFFINCNAIRFSGEVLLMILSVRLIPVLDRGSAFFDAEPLTQISTLCQRRSCSVGRARQPDQPSWRARPATIQKLHIRAARYINVEFFEEHIPPLSKNSV